MITQLLNSVIAQYRDLSSEASNAMFDELAERSLTSPLAGTKHTYVRLAIIIHCKILALSSKL